MTKQNYFEMCELMGMDVIESEIPVDITDFPEEVQTAFEIYHTLKDQWEGMSGTYMGKNITGISDIFDIFQIPLEDRRTYLEYISLIDNERTAIISAKQKQEENLRSNKSPN